MAYMVSDSPWLTNGIILIIVVATAALATVSTLRWGWKAWPLVLGAAFASPTIIAVILVIALPLLADRIGLLGYTFHLKTLVLIGTAAALLGFGAAMALRRLRREAR